MPLDLPHNPAPAYLTVMEVAQRLQVSPETVLRWIDSGVMPASNVTISTGAKRPRWRIDPADLRAFIESRRRGKPREVERPAPLKLTPGFKFVH